ncbi:peptidoglycan-binding protein [Selenomonas sp. GACV-9]|uniref:peptidoglycan-binding protein n=1 Tax=Selenomonas sp. GACV-9 TaxID=3158782 RepID=UPI00094D619A
MLLSLVVTLMLVCFCSAALAASILVKDGSRGHAVKHVQTLLIEQGYLSGEADGVCGPQTVAAIKEFQEAKGLEVDGICGDGTYSVLSGGRTYEPPAAESQVGHSGTVLYVTATAYSSQDPGNSPHTSMGTQVRRGVIAVDPVVIPLGTRVFIPGYGEAVAEDTGGFHGNHIDVAFDTHGEALAFGRQNLEIYILD